MKILMTSLLIMSSPAFCLPPGEGDETNNNPGNAVRDPNGVVTTCTAPPEAQAGDEDWLLVDISSDIEVQVTEPGSPSDFVLVSSPLTQAEAAVTPEESGEVPVTVAATVAQEGGEVPAQTQAEEQVLGRIRPELQSQLPGDWTADGYHEKNRTLSNMFSRPREEGWSDADILANHYIRWGRASGLQYKDVDEATAAAAATAITATTTTEAEIAAKAAKIATEFENLEFPGRVENEALSPFTETFPANLDELKIDTEALKLITSYLLANHWEWDNAFAERSNPLAYALKHFREFGGVHDHLLKQEANYYDTMLRDPLDKYKYILASNPELLGSLMGENPQTLQELLEKARDRVTRE